MTTYNTNYARQSQIKHYKNQISKSIEKILHKTRIKKRSEVHIAKAMPSRQLPRQVN
jgi:hypothetical protein